MLYFSRWSIYTILIISVMGVLFTVPNFFAVTSIQEWPEWMQRQVKLGLDLQGGSSLLLEVDLDNVITDRLNTLLDSVRSRLRNQNIDLLSAVVEEESIMLSFADPDATSRAEEEINTLVSPVNPGILATERQFDISSSENEITLTLSRLRSFGVVSTKQVSMNQRSSVMGRIVFSFSYQVLMILNGSKTFLDVLRR